MRMTAKQKWLECTYLQDAWTRWKLELWRPLCIKFLIQSVYDVFPSATNLYCLEDTPACQLCQKSSTLEHILSCSLKAMGDGWYCWHIDIDIVITNSKHQHTSKQSITFGRAGEKAQKQPSSSRGLLTTARD